MRPPEIRQAAEIDDGGGTRLWRLFPLPGELLRFDPFTLCDHFQIRPGGGLPPEPQADCEILTYLLAGQLEHEDLRIGRLFEGGARYIADGPQPSGSERAVGDQLVDGLRLGVALPADSQPGTGTPHLAAAHEIPEYGLNSARVRIVVGDNSPLNLHTRVRVLDLLLEPGARLSDAVPEPLRGFLYVVAGRVVVNGNDLRRHEACFVETGLTVALQAPETARVLICLGAPHGEPVQQYGPPFAFG